MSIKEERMNLTKTQRSILLLTLIAGLVLGGLFGNGLRTAKAAATQVAPDATPLQIPDPVQLSNSFSKLAKQLEPSVVQVTSTMEEKTARRGASVAASRLRIARMTCSAASSEAIPSAATKRPRRDPVVRWAPVPASSWTGTAM